MSPRPTHLRLVTDRSAEPRLSGDVCRRSGCAQTATALGFCSTRLFAYRNRRNATATASGDALAGELAKVLSDAAPLLYAAVNSATRRALREAAADILLSGGHRDLISAALAELLADRFTNAGTVEEPDGRRRSVRKVAQFADPDRPVCQ